MAHEGMTHCLKIQYLLIRKDKRAGQRKRVKEKEGCTW
jgi:hypothetical protein